MFTGIIQAVGSIAAIEPQAGDCRLRILTADLPLTDVALGDSIATNGVCLTATALPGDGFWADVSGESLRRTTLGELKPGDAVNLELAMTPTSRLGGHLVSGHVDGMGEVLQREPQARSIRFRIKAPGALARYIAEKGSITVDGISLTVNGVEGAVFELNIVPHTMQETIMAGYRVGTRVNLEVDVIARYLERLLQAGEAPSAGGVSRAMLAENGFL